MLDHWQTEVAREPLADIAKVAQMDYASKIVNGIDVHQNTLMLWTPVQLALSWGNEEVVRFTIEELLLLGADLNSWSRNGLTPLCLLIILIFYRGHMKNDVKRLFWFLTKGIDVNKCCVIQNGLPLVLSPLDLLIQLQQQTFRIHRKTFLPRCTEFGKDRRRKLAPSIFKKCLVALLCYGARASVFSPDIEQLLGMLPWCETDDPHIADLLTTGLKLPSGLSRKEIHKRAEFLFQNRRMIPYDDARKIRRRMLGLSDSQGKQYFYNTEFEDEAEFMTYEFLDYEDSGGVLHRFHKTLFPALARTGHNPFTRTPIPREVLRRWCREISDRPLIFNRLFRLRDTLGDEGGAMGILTLPIHSDRLTPVEESRRAFEYLHSVIAACFPYSSIYELLTFSEKEVELLLESMNKDSHNGELVVDSNPSHESSSGGSALWRPLVKYIQEPYVNLGLLHFAVEETIQDLASYKLIRETLVSTSYDFGDNMLEVVLHVPRIGEILGDRIGCIHLAYFQSLWERMQSLDKKFS